MLSAKRCCFYWCLMAWPALGHPGHDHGHWSAELLHYALLATFILTLVAVLYALVNFVMEKSTLQNHKNKGNNQAV